MRVGVNGQTLTEADIKKRGYKISLQEGQIGILVPFGAQGGNIKVDSKKRQISVLAKN